MPKAKPARTSRCKQCDVCIKARDVDLQISDTRHRIYEEQRALETLLEQRQRLKTQRNRVHNQLILQMPPEIASYIFQLCVPYHADASRESLYEIVRSRFALGAVCQGWRRIAWSTPKLWTTVSICFHSPKFANHVDLIKEWISRSGALPLSFHIYVTEVKDTDVNVEYADGPYFGPYMANEDALQTVQQLSDRWEELDVRLPGACLSDLAVKDGTAPAFNSLILESTDGEANSAEFPMNLSPTHITFRSVSIRFIEITWSNVTDAFISETNLKECYDLLTVASRLTSCTFVTIRDVANYLMPVDPVVHSELQELKVEKLMLERDPSLFFGCFTLPSLQILFISMNGTQDLPCQAILDMFERSSCKLKELQIQNTEYNGNDIVALLQATASLVKLDLAPACNSYNSPYSPFQALTESLLQAFAQTSISPDSEEGRQGEKCSFLPNLQHLQYNAGQQRTFPWGSIPLAFGPISELSTPRCQLLRSLHLYFRGQSKIFIPEATISSLLALKDTGVDVQILNGRGVDEMKTYEKHRESGGIKMQLRARRNVSAITK